MKIAATSDIHYDLIRSKDVHNELKRLIKSLEADKPDVLLIAGDIVGLGWAKLEECFRLFEKISPEKLMVFGNHEYWCVDLDTFRHLEKLETRIENCGFHLLDRNSKIVGDIGFAGNCGWYDYSLAEKEPPSGFSYERKVFNEHIIWNDALFIRLGKSDSEYTVELLEKLECDITRLENNVDTIVAVTHHVGFQEMVVRKEKDSVWNFTNAFMGSKKLGQMLLRHPKVKYHICGHTHHKSYVEKGHLLSINIGTTYHKKKYVIFEVS